MFVKTPVITQKTRKHIDDFLGQIFNHKEGSGLNDVLDEVFNDRHVFLYLLAHLPRAGGLEVGSMSYFDDIHIEVPYGLTFSLPENHTQGRIILFTYEQIFGRRESLDFWGSSFPTSKGKINYEHIPSTEELAAKINYALINISAQNITDLSKITGMFPARAK